MVLLVPLVQRTVLIRPCRVISWTVALSLGHQVRLLTPFYNKINFFCLTGMQDGAMGMGHMGSMGYSSINPNLRSPVHSQMLLPGHPHAAMMMGHPMGHPGLPQGSPYDSSGQHIMDIHAS